MPPINIQHELTLPRELALKRLDQALASQLPQYSRGRLQEWIKSGELTVNGQPAKAKDKVVGGEKVSLSAIVLDAGDDAAEDIPLNVIFEDQDILVLNKPPGLVVHPGAGNPHGTLLNALLNHESGLAAVPRAGIVHRLDKETSGLMVVAKHLAVQNQLVKNIQERVVGRIYDALVYGVVPPLESKVEGAIGRHPVHRKKMALRQDGKPAVTHYRALQNFREHTWVECRLETGRTHQIRVHMQSLGFPLIGDPTYGGHYRRPKFGDDWLIDTLRAFNRQALHAKKLRLIHPTTGKELTFRADPPEDFVELREALEDNLA